MEAGKLLMQILENLCKRFRFYKCKSIIMPVKNQEFQLNETNNI